jgi:uncharacterized secreted protein with C-terminal beta-propeller domain
MNKKLISICVLIIALTICAVLWMASKNEHQTATVVSTSVVQPVVNKTNETKTTKQLEEKEELPSINKSNQTVMVVRADLNKMRERVRKQLEASKK